MVHSEHKSHGNLPIRGKTLGCNYCFGFPFTKCPSKRINHRGTDGHFLFECKIINFIYLFL